MGDAVYILKQGVVQVVKDGNVLRSVGKHGIFGERALLEQSLRTATVIAVDSLDCFVLYREAFNRVADDGVRQHLLNRMKLQNDKVSLNSLVGLKLLGKGTFGNVFLVRDEESKSLYALKTVARAMIRTHRLASDLQLERELLLQLEFPFVMKLVKTFKDKDRVYFLTEFVQGRDLFDVLATAGKLPEVNCQFYVACLLIVLEHLHEQDILYRDVKPENVIIDDTGYPKLIDFGLAKRVEGRTFTHVGTPHYTAPEVLMGTGYGQAVDFWSLGVMCYELVCGMLPFANFEDDPHIINEEILHGKLTFPSSIPKKSAIRSFIESLLSRNPNLRLAEGKKFRTHQWFCGLDWVRITQEQLLMRQLTPPYVPAHQDLMVDETALNKSPESLMTLITVLIHIEGRNSNPDISAAVQRAFGVG